ncbi:Chitin synthase, class 3 [Phlyctochytrium bullatum]|nr:Chitin synthase, class 3 [Phlyctochytrium bullatum]
MEGEGWSGPYALPLTSFQVTLCIIIGCMMATVAFLSFGLQTALCPGNRANSYSDAILNQDDHLTMNYRNSVIIYGNIYDFTEVRDRLAGRGNIQLTADWLGRDITALFQPSYDACSVVPSIPTRPCTIPNRFPGSPSLGPAPGDRCPSYSWLEGLQPSGRGYFTWRDIESNTKAPHTLTVFNGVVLNLTDFYASYQSYFDSSFVTTLSQGVGLDVTKGVTFSYSFLAQANCLKQLFIAGYLDREPVGCVATQAIQSVCLAVILCVVMTRFLMAITFHWCISTRISRPKRSAPGFANRAVPQPTVGRNQSYIANGPGQLPGPQAGALFPYGGPKAAEDDHYTIMLVTCYSEGKEGIRNTLESLASTQYPDSHKLLFVIADGLITGAGNAESTPEAIISMMRFDNPLFAAPEPKSYLAIAHGVKQHNMAQVYAGYYYHEFGGRVPMIAVVKCGTPAEKNEPKQKKAGNRGKRDSQLVLMNFLSRVLFNDRMTPLDYELCWKIQTIAHVTPDRYTLALMVDADTKVALDSVKYMVQAMKNDPTVMGLCGETRIANKTTSWVTAIQVFEYYISHHLGKAFESVFGGVTCLPGCFCMYRIKAPKGPHGAWMVPILANPDIVDEYSENIVDTLHKKNLLLLGEDRFLTTLMLRTFPKRKMIFVPQAICRTVVPDTFKMLLSQRRRWINSTVHNLLELVLLRDLCGIFCFSMQFVVMLELIGTIVLPAAIIFVFVLLFSAAISGKVAMLPMAMLLATLGLPGLLIVITTRKLVYLLWMFVYILALPVWNFVLPLYAFWHFDDFTWGETRKVEGESSQKDHSGQDGEYEIGAVTLRTWEDWEVDRRMRMRMGANTQPDTSSRALPPKPVITEAVGTVEEVAMSMEEELSSSSKFSNAKKSMLNDEASYSWLAHTGDKNSSLSSASFHFKDPGSILYQNLANAFKVPIITEKGQPVRIDSVVSKPYPPIPDTIKESEKGNIQIGPAAAAVPTRIRQHAPPPQSKPAQTQANAPARKSSEPTRPSNESFGTSRSLKQANESALSSRSHRKQALSQEAEQTSSDLSGFLVCSTPKLTGRESFLLDYGFDANVMAQIEVLDECLSLNSEASSLDARRVPEIPPSAEPSYINHSLSSYSEMVEPKWNIDRELRSSTDTVRTTSDVETQRSGRTRGPRPMPF